MGLTPQALADAIISDGDSYATRLSFAKNSSLLMRMRYYRDLCYRELAKPIYQGVEPVLDLGSGPLNQAAWTLHEALPEVPPEIFNVLKPALHAALTTFLGYHRDHLIAIWRTELAIAASHLIHNHMQAHVKEL